jgi:hypothetical protein
MSKITLAPNASGTGTLTVAAPNTNTDRTITLPDATGTAIINKGSEIFNIDSGGNLGMGTSSPVGAGLTLNLQGSTSSSYSSIVAGSPSNANFVSFYSGQTPDPNPSIIYNNSLRIGSATSPNTSGYVERMRIDSSGNVGIGTSSPSYRVDVASADTTAGAGYAVRIRANATADAGAIQFTDSTAATQNGLIAVDTSSNMKFTTSLTERMRIDVLGDVQIGTTTSGGKLSLSWNSAAQQGFVLRTTAATFAGSPVVFRLVRARLRGLSAKLPHHLLLTTQPQTTA